MEKYRIGYKDQKQDIEGENLLVRDEPVAVIYKSPIGYISVIIDEEKGRPFSVLKDRANNIWLVPISEKEIYEKRLEHMEETIVTDGHYHVE